MLGTNRAWIARFLSAVLVVTWGTVAPAGAQTGPLDGKTFVGEMTEKGKAKGDKDQFIFKAWKFRSTGCDRYGFKEAEYTTAESEGAMRFAAEANSPKEGTMKWTGTVKGDTIEGTAVWTKKGQADVTYTFKGTLKK